MKIHHRRGARLECIRRSKPSTVVMDLARDWGTMHPISILSTVLSVFISVGTASSALAQAPGMTSVPQTPPPGAAPPGAQPYGQPSAQPYGQPGPRPVPSSGLAPNGEYVAPLSQTTQQVYIPQSVALSGPRMIKDYQEGQPIPYGYHREDRVRKGAIITGASVFGGFYLYSALIASIGADVSSGSNRAASLFVPVFGPFLELAESDSTTLSYLLVLDGLAQATGAALVVWGITSPRAVLVRDDLASVTLMPARLGKDATGVVVIGRF